MSEHIQSLILYHLVSPIKYRRSVLNEPVELSLVEVRKNISNRYEIHFIEIGADDNHVHFLIQSVPVLSCEVITRTIKRITAKELFRLHPEVKIQLWGGKFWSSGYYINTVGQYASEDNIKKYIQNQGEDVKKYKSFNINQIRLFD